jgi:hypothetical protein
MPDAKPVMARLEARLLVLLAFVPMLVTVLVAIIITLAVLVLRPPRHDLHH